MFRSKKAISDGGKQTALGTGCVVALFTEFLLMGLVVTWLSVSGPALRINKARHWPSAPCTVLSSEVESHSGEGASYSILITYEYQYNGQRYTSDRYSFFAGSSIGRSGKAKVVAAHPPGRETVCYVNPDDPSDAVLHRGLTADMWFRLVPLLFVVIGAAGVVFGLRSWRRARQALAPGIRRGAKPPSDRDDYLPAFNLSDEPATLRSRQGRWARLFGKVFLAAFCNGIFSVLLVGAVKQFRAGELGWLPIAALILFVVVGLVLIVSALYSALGIMNPRPILTANRQAAPLGATLNLVWDVTGRAQRMRALRVTLEGREQATYTRGTSTTTDEHIFAEIALFDTQEPSAMAHGSASVTIPVDTMHSLAAPNNKIVWAICFHGDVPRWPDVKERFPIVVLPVAEGGGV